jgi:hypothetical protein
LVLIFPIFTAPSLTFAFTFDFTFAKPFKELLTLVELKHQIEKHVFLTWLERGHLPHKADEREELNPNRAE